MIVSGLGSGEDAFLLESRSEDWEKGFSSSQRNLRWMNLLVHASLYPDRCPLESIVGEKYYVSIWWDEKFL